MEKEFLEKKAEEYIAKMGEDEAIERLSKLAAKSQQAKTMLDTILSKVEPMPEKPEPAPKPKKPDVRPMAIMTVRRAKQDPKQRYENIINNLELPYDTQADQEWRPIVDVDWNRGRANINGKRVTFGRKYLDFMKKNVLGKEKEVVTMHIVTANKDRVVAEPDIEKYRARKRAQIRQAIKRREASRRKFEGTVIMNEYSIRIISSNVNKRIIVPKRFMNKLLVNMGTWRFESLKEDADKIVAEPVEQVEKAVSYREDSKLDVLMNGGVIKL